MLTLAFLVLPFTFTGDTPTHYSLPTTVIVADNGAAYVACDSYSVMINTDRGLICSAD